MPTSESLTSQILRECPRICKLGFQTLAKSHGADDVAEFQLESVRLAVWVDRDWLDFAIGTPKVQGVYWSPETFDAFWGEASIPHLKHCTLASMDVWVAHNAQRISDAFETRKWKTWSRLIWISSFRSNRP